MAPDMRLHGIDFLRGVAALSIVFHHVWYFGSRQQNFLSINRFGYVAVDLFFVISGFCLSWPYYSSPEKVFVPRKYGVARFWRIFPPYAAAFLILLVLGYLFRHSGNPSLQSVKFALPISRRHIIEGFFLYCTVLATPFWTLVVEARWYVAFIFMLTLSRKVSIWLMIAICIILSVWHPNPFFGIGKLEIYLPCFACGILCARIWANQHMVVYRQIAQYSPLALIPVLVLAACILPDCYSKLRSTYAEVFPTALLFSVLLIVILRYWDRFSAAGGWLQKLGLFSYSLYLVHEPCIQLIHSTVRTSGWSQFALCMFWYVGVVLFVVGLAYLFYLCFEKPFIGRKGWRTLGKVK